MLLFANLGICIEKEREREREREIWVSDCLENGREKRHQLSDSLYRIPSKSYNFLPWSRERGNKERERERERERDKKRTEERVRDRKGGESELREIESETGSEERVREGGEREGRRIKSWVSVGYSAWRVKESQGRESERRVRWERKRE